MKLFACWEIFHKFLLSADNEYRHSVKVSIQLFKKLFSCKFFINFSLISRSRATDFFKIQKKIVQELRIPGTMS